MVSILLTILKILGIILLVLLGIVLVVLVLVLFVPIRYRLDAHRNLQEDAPVVAAVKATWLMHLISVFFSYPDAAYVCVKLLGITLYRSDREKKPKKKSDKSEDKKTGSENYSSEDCSLENHTPVDAISAEEESIADATADNTADNTWDVLDAENEENGTEDDVPASSEETPTLKRFITKLWDKIINIKYTITQICDKIKHIVKNIRYYIKVLQSKTFQNAFSLCSGELLKLLKSIRPRKVKGRLLIGTGDPASTGQVLSVYGMLYPFIGNNIDIIPDFENQIVEGELLVKGRITVFKALKMALVVFFNKDVRRLIKLLKREAV